MFKSQGRKNFESCSNKEVATTTSKDALLRCAVTSAEGFHVSNRGWSRTLMEHMAKSAGAALCSGCIYANMTREDVHTMRAREAETAAIRLEAEHRLQLLQRQLQGEADALPAPQIQLPAAEQ